MEVQSDNSIIKTAPYGSNNGGAASVEILPANTDGWVEFTAYATGHERYIGLSSANPDATNAIDFAIKLSGTLHQRTCNLGQQGITLKAMSVSIQ